MALSSGDRERMRIAIKMIDELRRERDEARRVARVLASAEWHCCEEQRYVYPPEVSAALSAAFAYPEVPE